MNHTLWTSVGARVLALTFVLAGAAACGDKLSETSSKGPGKNEASSSAVVIGQAPAEPAAQPSSETAATTAPAGAQGDLTKAQENVQRPKEGDNHSHSTLAPVTPQKSEGASAVNMERK